MWRDVARYGEMWGDWEIWGNIAGGGFGKADGGRSRGKVEGGCASSARCGQWLVGAATTVRECVAQQGGVGRRRRHLLGERGVVRQRLNRLDALARNHQVGAWESERARE